MNVGDLVHAIDEVQDTGIILRVIDNVEIPPLIEILWDTGYISKAYEDDLVLINEAN